MAQALTRSEVANKIIAGLEAILRTKIEYKEFVPFPDRAPYYRIIDITLPRGYVYHLNSKGRTFILEVRTLGHDPIGKIDVTISRKISFIIHFPPVMAEVSKWAVETKEKEYYLVVEDQLDETYLMLSDSPLPEQFVE